MKKFLFFVILCACLSVSSAWAQKFGYIDSEFVLNKMPEYKQAQSEIDKFADKWSKDIQEKYAEIDRLQRTYQAEEMLLTDEMKRERQRLITDKEREAREYNNRVFGYEGLLFQKKKELMKGPMNQVQRALDKVAIQKKLDFIFDKASDFVMLYTNPRHDYTDYVMEELGLATDNKTAKPISTQTAPVSNSALPNQSTVKPK